MYDTYRNHVGTTPFGAALMVRLIKEKYSTSERMSFYYNNNNAALVPALDLAYKEWFLSRFIIMNGDMKEGRDKMLRNQIICGTKSFDITYGQSMSLLDRESTKTRMQCNKNSKKRRETKQL